MLLPQSMFPKCSGAWFRGRHFERLRSVHYTRTISPPLGGSSSPERSSLPPPIGPPTSDRSPFLYLSRSPVPGRSALAVPDRISPSGTFLIIHSIGFVTSKRFPLTNPLGFLFPKRFPLTNPLGFLFSKRFPLTNLFGFLFPKRFPLTNPLGFLFSKRFPLTNPITPTRRHPGIQVSFHSADPEHINQFQFNSPGYILYLHSKIPTEPFRLRSVWMACGNEPTKGIFNHE